MLRGKLITFEGCEGVGKSTQVRLLKEHFDAIGKDALFIREPGGNAVSERIRSVILDPALSAMTAVTEVLLYAASRAQLVGEVIEPALAAGRTVVCDRYTDSTYAYQGYARGLGSEFVEQLNNLSCGNTVPDLTVFLDLPPEKAFARKGGRDASDRLELEGGDFHRKVYQGYLAACKAYPDRIVKIFPTGTKLETHDKILSLLKERGLM